MQKPLLVLVQPAVVAPAAVQRAMAEDGGHRWMLHNTGGAHAGAGGPTRANSIQVLWCLPKPANQNDANTAIMAQLELQIQAGCKVPSAEKWSS